MTARIYQWTILKVNNPEKYQYDKSEVVAHNGFRYRQYLTDVGVDTDVILQEIVQWIRESNCYEYGDLVDYAVSEKFDEWFPTVRSQTIFLTAYLRSNRHKPFKKIDRETGEILEWWIEKNWYFERFHKTVDKL